MTSPPDFDLRGVCFHERLRERIDALGGRSVRRRIQEHLGISASTLSQYQKGSVRPSFERLIALAELLELSLDDLVFGRKAPRVLPDAVRDEVPGLDRLRRFEGEVRTRAALTQRVGRELARSIDAAVERVALRSALPRVLDDEDSLVLEGFSRHTRTLGLRLDYLIRIGEEGAEAGPFLQRLAHNLEVGRPYDFVLAAREGVRWDATARALQERLRDAHGLSVEGRARCRLHRTDVPVGAAFVLYELEVSTLRRDEPFLYELVREHLSDDGWLGAVQPPSADLGLDMLMDRDHLAHARSVFDAVLRARGTKPVEVG